jgi:hypothetical protein
VAPHARCIEGRKCRALDLIAHSCRLDVPIADKQEQGSVQVSKLFLIMCDAVEVQVGME